MLKVVTKLRELEFSALMAVYAEGNRENAGEFYPQLPENQGVLQAEQDFYAYLKESFFPVSGAAYFIWEEGGRYISALRLEPYEDGLLLEALETAPEERQKGYAKALIRAALQWVWEQGGSPVYSHVSKRNAASLAVHFACGFRKHMDYAAQIDGSVSYHSLTFCFQFSPGADGSFLL